MNKKEFLLNIKYILKSKGFKNKGNFFYVIIDIDYLIGIYLDHHPFCDAYYIEYGVVFLPDGKNSPLSGEFDWSDRFLFKKNDSNNNVKIDYLEYDNITFEQLNDYLNINFNDKFNYIYNKNYIIDQFKNDWILFRYISYDKVKKISKLVNLNYEDIVKFRDSTRTSWK